MLRSIILGASIAGSSALCADLKAKLASVDLSAVAGDVRLSAATAEPEQLHLSLTGDASEMFVTFVVNTSSPCADAAVVLDSSKSFPAAYSTYSAGVVGWYGSIYTARLTGLTPGGAHSYVATACGGSSASVDFNAAAVPAASLRSRVAVKADMGTVIPLGFATAEQITKDNLADPFDLVMLAGDLCKYATQAPPTHPPISDP
jgi:hypothetical protein